MQKSLLSWRLNLFCLILMYCFNSTVANGQLSYTFSTVSGTYTALSSYTTIISGVNDDAVSGATNIGFTFKYGCNNYTEFRASSNGWLSLGNNTLSSVPANDLSATGKGPLIAPLWDDLQTSSFGVRYQLTGSSPNRVLTIEWNGVRWDRSAGGSVISFQAKLYETTNVIEFCYFQNNNAVNNGSASIGISGGFINTDFYSVSSINGTAVATYSTETNNQNTKPGTGRIYRWAPNNMSYISTTTTRSQHTFHKDCCR